MNNPNFEWDKAVANLSRWRLQQRFEKADNPNVIATFVNGPQHNFDMAMPRNSSPFFYFPIYEKDHDDWWRTDVKKLSPSEPNKKASYQKIAEGLTFAIFMYVEE